MSLPSGSKLQRAMACLASAVLPRVDSESEQGNRGKALHAFFADLQKMDREAALDRVAPEHREAVEAVDVEQLPVGLEYVAEIALVYDVATEKTRLIGYDVAGAYGELAPTEIPMQLDLAGVGDGFVVVGDYKTGRGHIPPAHRNWQLKAGALAMARFAGKDSARVSLYFVHDGEVTQGYAEFDSFDLMTIAADLRILASRIEVEREHWEEMKASGTDSKAFPLRASMGEHCRYCPSLPFCPAQTAMVRRMAQVPEEAARDIQAMLTPELASKAYERLKLVRGAMAEVERALRAYAATTPIPLGDGQVFGQVTREQEVLDPLVVRDVLRELHGLEVADKGVELDTSKAAIDRAVRVVHEARRKAGEKVTLKALNEAVLEAVRAKGGVDTKTRTEVREHAA